MWRELRRAVSTGGDIEALLVDAVTGDNLDLDLVDTIFENLYRAAGFTEYEFRHILRKGGGAGDNIIVSVSFALQDHQLTGYGDDSVVRDLLEETFLESFLECVLTGTAPVFSIDVGVFASRTSTVRAARGSSTTAGDDRYISDVVGEKMARNCDKIAGRGRQFKGAPGLTPMQWVACYIQFALTVPTSLTTTRGKAMGGCTTPKPEIWQVGKIYGRLCQLRNSAKMLQGPVETIHQVPHLYCPMLPFEPMNWVFRVVFHHCSRIQAYSVYVMHPD